MALEASTSATRTPLTDEIIQLKSNVQLLTDQLNAWSKGVEDMLSHTEMSKMSFSDWGQQVSTTLDKDKMDIGHLKEEKTRMTQLLEEVKKDLTASEDRIIRNFRAELSLNKTDIQRELSQELNGIHTTILEERQKAEERILALEGAVRSRPSAPGPSAAPFVAPPAPPGRTSISSASNVQWTKKLQQLRYREVKEFVSLFRAYMKASEKSGDELKLVLLLSLEGDALRLLSPVAEASSIDELLEKLLNRVRPSQSILESRLKNTKQKVRESVFDFGARFQLMASDLPTYADDRILDIFVENLNDTWKMTARSLILGDPACPVPRLLEILMKLEGTDAADKMEVDHLEPQPSMHIDPGQREPAEVNQVVSGGRINWREVTDERSLIYAWKQLMRSNGQFRENCLQWVRMKPNGNQGPGYRGQRPDNRQYQPRGGYRNPPNGRIFHAEPTQEMTEIQEDDIFEEAVNEGIVSAVEVEAVTRKSLGSPARRQRQQRGIRRPSHEINTTQGKHHPLMYLRARVKGSFSDFLIDTGAAVSMIPEKKAAKWGLQVDESRKQTLTAFNETQTESAGVAAVEIEIGNELVKHEFCIGGSKLIIGNDLLEKQAITIEPAKRRVVTKDNWMIPCFVVNKPSEEPRKQKSNWDIRVTEPRCVDPVQKEDVLFVPAGKSFSLAARPSGTFILPYISSRASHIFDSSRLSPGVITSAAIWMKGQKLRVTITNTTPQAVMVGSRAAIAAVSIDPGNPPTLRNPGGETAVLRRV